MLYDQNWKIKLILLKCRKSLSKRRQQELGLTKNNYQPPSLETHYKIVFQGIGCEYARCGCVLIVSNTLRAEI